MRSINSVLRPLTWVAALPFSACSFSEYIRAEEGENNASSRYFIARFKSMGLRSSIGKQGRRTLPPSFYCTVFRRHRACSSRC